MTDEQTIPVVDLERYTSGDPEARRAFVEAFGEGLEEFGFVAVEGHEVPQSMIDDTYEVFEEFFDLDESTKRQYERPETDHQRGFTPFGLEQAKDHETPDLKEFWHVGREFDDDSPLAERMPSNVWPDEVPEFREQTLKLWRSLESSAMTMLEALSEFLGASPSTLPDKAEQGNSILRVIYYPVCEGFEEPGAMRAAEHEDINLITLLPTATQSGLEILTREGEWLSVPAIDGQLIVDTGDMMKRLTNDTLPATTHRVVNPEGDPEPRYSMPFFVHPHPDARLDVLDCCTDEETPPKYDPITADQFLEQRLEQTGVASEED